MATASDTTLQIEPGKPVELPSGDFVANAEFMRTGHDLQMTSPEGDVIVIKDYFAQDPAPDIVTADGAHLSSEMVDAFLPPQHVGQYADASAGTASDVSAAGQIVEVVGEVTVVRADGTKVQATAGTPVYPGDVVETSGDGAANILFADNTTFAISESARLSIDEFVYNAAEQEGSSFFSMLQGVFVYTSGLIGKNDPGNVNIETPVGSIGIRGTVVAGDINAAGEESKITIVDGAVVLTNQAGTLELNDSFETASVSSYTQEPSNIGQIDAATFTSTYQAVSTVAATTFSDVQNYSSTPTGDSTQEAPQPEAAPDSGDGASTDAPADSTQTATADALAETADQPVLTTTETTMEGEQVLQPAPEGEAPPPPTGSEPLPPPPGTEPVLQPMMFMPPPPPPTGTFDSTQTTFSDGSGDFSGTTSTTTTTTTTSTFTGSTTLLPPPPPPPEDGTFDGTEPIVQDTMPPPVVRFNFSPLYLNFTPGTTSDDGIRLFRWQENSEIGRVDISDFSGPRTYTLAFNSPNGSGVLTSSGYITGNGYTNDGAGDGDPYDTVVVGGNPLFFFDATTGILKLVDPLAMNSTINGGYSFTITAKDSGGMVIGTHSFGLLTDPFTGPVFLGTSGNDGNVAANTGGIQLAGSNNAVFAGFGDDRVALGTSSTGNMIALHDGNDLAVVSNSLFGAVDGGAGVDKLLLAGPNVLYDFINDPIYAKGVETLMLGGGTDASDVKLGLQDIFEMTNGGLTTLVIKTQLGSGQTGDLFIDTDALTVQAGTLATGTVSNMGSVTLTGVYNTKTLTLIIEQGGSTDGVVVNNI